MKTMIKKTRCLWIALIGFLFVLFLGNVGGMYAVKASADTDDAFIVQQYDVDMTVQADRKIAVYEKMTIFVNTKRQDATMFYRSLPTQGARYTDIEAKCQGNNGFYFYVADNEEVSGFIDVCCVGNISYGKVWTYEITYVMEQDVNTVKNGMTMDVIGYGWTVPLHNVTVNMRFPGAVVTSEVYTDVFGEESGNTVTEAWSQDKKTLTLHADVLKLAYSDKYNETVAGGITLEFALEDGVLMPYAKTRIFTKDMWKVCLGSGIAIVVGLLIFAFFRSKRDVITVVNITPPDGMDPMKMGKWIDGTVNNEDVTSMIYYFANKGYLKIDLTDQDDPLLISTGFLPDDAPAYEKTLFNGLFNGAQLVQVEQPTTETAAVMSRAIHVSKLEGKFFQASQTAMKQVPDAPPMYEPKSIFTYVSGAIIGAILSFVIPFILSSSVGGGYRYYFGIFLALPLFAISLIGYFSENYRYKWSKSKRMGLFIVEGVVALLFAILFCLFFAAHVMTLYEKAVLCVGVFASAFATQFTLTRSEEYMKELEDILGFKEFIVVTEEDKIKVMLEESPELYYKVLPYAQVLGVTDVWEDKFKGLTLQPPTWCVGSDMTWFDYYLIRRYLNRSMMLYMARAASEAMNSGGGRFVGRSGGGGSFGGFGGGGFGGGGGGIR